MDYERLQSVLDHWQRFAPCLGVNLSISYGADATSVWHGASGYADTEGRLMKPCQEGYIYSIGKTFTAVLVMKLVEAAELELDQPVQRYLHGLGFLPKMTVRQLLNHTSGIPNYTDWSDYPDSVRASPSEPWGDEAFVERLKSHIDSKGNDFLPGASWNYSNTRYWILKCLIEHVSGCSYADNINHRISQPLGLVRTRVAIGIQCDQICLGFSRELNTDQAMLSVNEYYHPDWCYTALIVSTTEEVNSFYAQLFSGNVVSLQSLNEMCQFIDIGRSAGPHFVRPSYGLGLMIDSETTHGGSIGHGGGGPGFSTWAVRYADFLGEPLGMTILCNTSMGGHPAFLVRDVSLCLGFSATFDKRVV